MKKLLWVACSKINPRVQRCVHCVRPNSRCAVSTPDGRLAGVSLSAGTGWSGFTPVSTLAVTRHSLQPRTSQPQHVSLDKHPVHVSLSKHPVHVTSPVFRCSMSYKDPSDVRLNVLCQSKNNGRTRCNHLNRFVM